MKISATRYHDISCGHRVVGHENKCRHLHGHNYRITFTCEGGEEGSGLDSLGRVIDFSVMKERLCAWIEEHWDHKFIVWEKDPVFKEILARTGQITQETMHFISESIWWATFNPTAENMAEHLLNVVGPRQLRGVDVTLTRVIVEETRKCSAEASL